MRRVAGTRFAGAIARASVLAALAALTTAHTAGAEGVQVDGSIGFRSLGLSQGPVGSSGFNDLSYGGQLTFTVSPDKAATKFRIALGFVYTTAQSAASTSTNVENLALQQFLVEPQFVIARRFIVGLRLTGDSATDDHIVNKADTPTNFLGYGGGLTLGYDIFPGSRLVLEPSAYFEYIALFPTQTSATGRATDINYGADLHVGLRF